MSLRLVFPLALAVLTLAGCDLFEDIQGSDPVSVPLSSVCLESFPLSPNRTTEWDDDGTGPDVFVEIQNAAGASIGRSGITPDVDLTQPVTIPFAVAPEAPTETARLYVVVFDDDGGDVLDATPMGESQSFSVEDLRDSSGSIVLLDGRVDNGRAATYEVIR